MKIKDEEGKACTMVVRTLHWTVPHYSIWGLPFYIFYSTRFSQFFHQRPNQGIFRDLLCNLISPMVIKHLNPIFNNYLILLISLQIND